VAGRLDRAGGADPVERRRELRPGDHDDRFEARAPRVEDAVVEQCGAGWPDRLDLLRPAVAAADTGREDHERRGADGPTSRARAWPARAPPPVARPPRRASTS